MKKILLIITTMLTLYGGTYSRDLTYCLITNTTKKDRITLSKWIFSVLSQHPNLKPLSKVTPQIMDEYNKKIANIVKKLLYKDCKREAQLVLKYEPANLKKSFEVLGRIAIITIIKNPNVQKALIKYKAYLLNK
jgi:tRNA G37 N-methylase Trm5